MFIVEFILLGNYDWYNISCRLVTYKKIILCHIKSGNHMVFNVIQINANLIMLWNYEDIYLLTNNSMFLDQVTGM